MAIDSSALVVCCKANVAGRSANCFSILAVLISAGVVAKKAGRQKNNMPRGAEPEYLSYVFLILAGRAPGQRVKFLTKRSQARISDLKAHLGHSHLAGDQQPFC